VRPARPALVIGALSALAGVTLIWWERATVHRPIYVSELGARGMPSAVPFAVALILIAVGSVLIAAAGRHPTVRFPGLGRWSIAATLALSSVFFVVASQVSCTAGCPVPLTAGSSLQDLVHTVAAVLGFVAGCAAMLQVGLVRRRDAMTRISAAACVAVAAVTITGGMLSIFRTASDVGGVLEFVGTTIAVVWLVCYGFWLAAMPHGSRSTEVAEPMPAVYERPEASNAIS
jgi:hypothetical membrane protein